MLPEMVEAGVEVHTFAAPEIDQVTEPVGAPGPGLATPVRSASKVIDWPTVGLAGECFKRGETFAVVRFIWIVDEVALK